MFEIPIYRIEPKYFQKQYHSFVVDPCQNLIGSKFVKESQVHSVI